MKLLTKEQRDALTPNQALQILKDGNARFVNNSGSDRDLLQQVEQTAGGQNPFAIILSCIDSRASAELIFDQGIGDIFSCRIAGNIVNEDILGSMEFACKAAGSKLIVVLGHSDCGAIKGACDNVELGNLTVLLDKIKPAIAAENKTTDNRTSSNKEFVDNVTHINVDLAAQDILKRSDVLAEMVNNGEIAIARGVYDLKTGKVEFKD